MRRELLPHGFLGLRRKLSDPLFELLPAFGAEYIRHTDLEVVAPQSTVNAILHVGKERQDQGRRTGNEVFSKGSRACGDRAFARDLAFPLQHANVTALVA